MNIFKCIQLYLTRKYIKTIILCIIFVTILLGELLGICLYSIAKKGEQDAFIYNGHAFLITSEEGKLSEKVYEKILSMEHIEAVDCWKETLAVPIGCNNVKDHTGSDPVESDIDINWSTNCVVLLSRVSAECDERFRRESAVSLIEGDYPENGSNGVLIESRFAEQNQLSVGDSIEFGIEETGVICQYQVCGIYLVDSEFCILEDNPYGEGVYKYSPYNVIYTDYTYSSETIPFESGLPYGCEVYIDAADYIDDVATSLKEIIGDDAVIYKTSGSYLKNEAAIVTIMKNYSITILIYVSIIGAIILLLVLSFYAKQYEYDSGIYLVLGCKKRRVLLQYFMSMFIVLICSFLISIIIFKLSSKSLVNAFDTMAQEVVESSSYMESVEPIYTIPNLGLGFQIDLDTSLINQMKYFGVMLFGAMGLLLLSMAIPIYSITKSRPRDLLSK